MGMQIPIEKTPAI